MRSYIFFIEIVFLIAVETLFPTNMAGPGLDILFLLFYVILTPILFFKTLIKAFKNKNYWLPFIYFVALAFILVLNNFAYKLRQ